MNRSYIFCHMLTSLEKHWHGAAKDSWFQHLAIEVPGVDTCLLYTSPSPRDTR